MATKAIRMAECHTDRPHHARGMCALCYMKDYDRARSARRRKDPGDYAPNYRQPPRRKPSPPTCGHPDGRVAADGLCRACYQRSRRSGAVRVSKATCHPDRELLAAGLCHQCYSKKKYWDDPEQHQAESRQRQKVRREQVRAELVAAYGGRCACERCPETNTDFLTLDHVNGDGKQHRLEMGSHTYADLRRRGWPKDGYRLLCWNCNAMTRGGKACPHERE